MEVACDICGQRFPTNRPRQLRCSPACSKAAKERWGRTKRGVIPARMRGAIMQCLICGNDLMRKGATQQYCAVCKKIHEKAYARRYKGSAEERCIGAIFSCVVCGTSTARTGAHQKYCSDTCYAIANVRRDRMRHARVLIVGSLFSCHTCGKTSRRGRNWRQKYCSDVCRRAGERTAKRERLGRTQFVGALFACAICGTEALRTTGSQIYCSEECYQTAAYRHRAARIKTSIGTRYTRRHIFTRDGWRCQSCWKKVRDNVPLRHSARATIDHILPLTKGGLECESNVHTLCWPCNHAKGNRVGSNDQLRLALGEII